MAFIKIDRKLFNHYLWNEKPFDRARAWIDLIGLANHEDKDFSVENTLVHGKRGSVYRSKKWLANRWGWSEKKVRCFLTFLAKDGMISIKGQRVGRTNGTVITIEKYGVYQSQGQTKGQTKDGRRTPQGRVKDDIQEPIEEPIEEPKRNILPSAEDFSQPEPEDEDDEGWMKPEDLAKYHPTKFKRIGEK